jgi:hypothetical protein
MLIFKLVLRIQTHQYQTQNPVGSLTLAFHRNEIYQTVSHNMTHTHRLMDFLKVQFPNE